MKRKSILALILAVFIIVGISLAGCGSSKYRNNAANIKDNGGNTRGNMYDGITGNEAPRKGTSGSTTNNGNNANNANLQDNTNSSDTNINNGANNNNVSDGTRDGTKGTVDYTRYSAMNFRNDITNAGYSITESTDTKKDYFKGNETDFLLGGDVVRFYEYNSPTELEGDVNKISPNGLTINGTNANYTRRPYYYRKGNALIVYEGNEPAFVDEFRNMFGNSIK